MDTSEKFPSQLAERFQIRLPDGMRDRLKAEAEVNKRSMNAEIVARLEASLEDGMYAHSQRALTDEWINTLNTVVEAIEKRHREAIASYEGRIEALNKMLKGEITPTDIAETEARIREVAERLRAEAKARQLKAG